MNNDCNAVDFNSPDVPWSYCPSFPAAILFSSLFFIVSVAHLVQAVLLRKVRLRTLDLKQFWNIELSLE